MGNASWDSPSKAASELLVFRMQMRKVDEVLELIPLVGKRKPCGVEEMGKRTAATVKRFVSFIHIFINVQAKNKYLCDCVNDNWHFYSEQ